MTQIGKAFTIPLPLIASLIGSLVGKASTSEKYFGHAMTLNEKKKIYVEDFHPKLDISSIDLP